MLAAGLLLFRLDMATASAMEPQGSSNWSATTTTMSKTNDDGWAAATTSAADRAADSGVTIGKKTKAEVEALKDEYIPARAYGDAETGAMAATMKPAAMSYEKTPGAMPGAMKDKMKPGVMKDKMKPGAMAHKKKNPDEKWYSRFWPLGDRVEVKSLKEGYVPFMTEKDIIASRKQVLDPKSAKGRSKPGYEGKLLPGRPKLLFERGNGFLDTGKLDAGFLVPGLGTVWQPRLWTYAINRTTLQSFDNGFSGNETETELANRLDLFFNLQLTGTEKILLGLRLTDNNRPDRFTRYTFEGADEGFNNELNVNVETLFFEGDLGSVFQNLDRKGVKPIDFGFTVGRQPIVFQEGILINDTIDSVGLIRNNIPVPGTSNFRVSAMWGWNRLDRNDLVRDADQNMFGLFVAADTHLSTYNLDMIYVDDTEDGDGFYIGASAIQRLPFWGGVSTAFRINSSFALEEEIPGNVVGTGTLITAEISKTPHGSDDIVYFNFFLGIGNFTQAGREAIVGGPLANTGILFASPNLSTYGAEINPFTPDDVIGGAIGYQAFWDNKRRNLILEIATRHDLSGDGFDSLGFGAQLQQAVGQHVQLQLGAFYTINEDRDDGTGARAEIQIVY